MVNDERRLTPRAQLLAVRHPSGVVRRVTSVYPERLELAVQRGALHADEFCRT